MTKNTTQNYIDIIGVLIAAIACIAAIVVIPEVRNLIGLGEDNEEGVVEKQVMVVVTATSDNSSQGAKATATTSPIEPLNIAFFDDFDSLDRTYDSSLWECEHECEIDNISIENGKLKLQRNQEGWSTLLSRSIWAYDNVVSLSGKLQINRNSDLTLGWLALGKTASCNIENFDTPIIQCFFGPIDAREYETSKVPIDFDTWYEVKIEKEKESREVKYYLDGVLIGKYSPVTDPETTQIDLGIYSGNEVVEGLVFIDDVKLILSK